MKKQMPKSFFQGVRVCAVDNFQGLLYIILILIGDDDVFNDDKEH